MASEPPYKKTYNSILKMSSSSSNCPIVLSEGVMLPLIDLSRLYSGETEHERCEKEIAEAASEWGFFQVVNHGMPQDILEMMYYEGKKVFDLPFSEKTRENFLNLPKNSYRWGNPNANSPSQFYWSEALQIDLTEIPNLPEEHNNLRATLVACAREMKSLAQMLCELLGKQLNVTTNYFKENCNPGNSYIRINKYPPCALGSEVFGLIPHTDSDFLTVLSQDLSGGLELKKDGRWLAVKPHREALLVNIGDLFQALSNGVYKSVEHRVVSSRRRTDRFSIVFFFNPNQDTEIECTGSPKLYRRFTLREYKEQIHLDVKETGDKVGLSRFYQAHY